MPKNTIPLGSTTTRIPQHTFYDLRNIVPTTGNIWFSDSNCIGATKDGLAPDSALVAIDSDINLCVANNGDVIVAMEGHAESVIAANGIAMDVAGIRLLGLGAGRSRPVITFTTAIGASLDISAANSVIENMVFVCGIDDQTAMLNITAPDVTIRNCDFVLSDATHDAEIGILISSLGDRVTIEDCRFHATGNSAAVAGAISFGAVDNALIRRNYFCGYFGTSGAILNAAAAENVVIADNVILNRSADADNKLIVLHASTAALIAGNRGGIIDTTSPAPVTAAAAWVAGNYFSSDVGVAPSVLM